MLLLLPLLALAETDVNFTTTEIEPVESEDFTTPVSESEIPTETDPPSTATPDPTSAPTSTPTPSPTSIPTSIPTPTKELVTPTVLPGSSPLIKTIVIFICAALFAIGIISAIVLCVLRRRRLRAKERANMDIDQFMIPSGDGLELEEPLAPVH